MVTFLSALASLSKAHYLISHFPFALLAAVFIFRHHPIKKKLCRLLLVSAFFLVGTGLGLLLMEGLAFPLWHAVGGVALLITSLWLNYENRDSNARWAAAFAMAVALLSGVGLSFGESYFQPRRQDLFADDKLAFRKEIRPILDRKCVKCHDASLSQNHLDLSSSTGILKSKTLLPFIVPGEPDKSGFYLAISDNLASSRHMPRLAGELSSGEIEAVRNWILSDGKISAKPALPKDSFHDSKNWTFRKFTKPPVPDAPGATEVDRFLARSGWKPEPVSAEILHRRLSLTVTGLPPKNINKDYPALVDHYLASTHFGENFAAYWFDLVSFAEGAGFDGGVVGSTAAGYRKYVIQSLNQNLPFNRFLFKQLAASEDPKKDVQNPHLLKNQLPRHRDPYITADYAVNSVFSFGLGLEMRCARCHDHRTEPITQKNYFDLVNIFSGPMNLPGRFSQATPLGKQFLDLYEGSANDLESWRKQESDQQLDEEDLAEWLTSVDKGVGLYTSRVFVDHIWRFVFGRGFVAEAGNFGSGAPVPADIDLLNWLTHDFIEHGFSIKHLLKHILLSEAFRSRMDLPGGPFASRRLMAENIRDNMLLAADSLNLHWGPQDIDDRFVEPGKPGSSAVLPEYLGPGRHHLDNRRSIYFERSRDLEAKSAFSVAFGQPTGFECVPQRQVIPSTQEATFYAKNSLLRNVIENMAEQASADRSKLVLEAYLRIFSRAANDTETVLWKEHFERDNSRESVKSFFHTLLSGAEFLYIP